MDAAFKTAPFSGYTTAQLTRFLNVGAMDDAKANAMAAELVRREAVASGDRSKMTPGERLRAAQSAA